MLAAQVRIRTSDGFQHDIDRVIRLSRKLSGLLAIAGCFPFRDESLDVVRIAVRQESSGQIQTFGRRTGQFDQFLIIGGGRGVNRNVSAELLHLFEELRAVLIEEAGVDRIRLGAFDLGDDRAEVGQTPVEELGEDHFAAVGLDLCGEILDHRLSPVGLFGDDRNLLVTEFIHPVGIENAFLGLGGDVSELPL